VIKSQLGKNKLLPLIVGIFISFLAGVFIPVGFFSWIAQDFGKNSSSGGEIKIASAENTQENVEITPVVSPPQDLTKLGKTTEAFKGKIINQVSLPSDRKVIALTFDDGPSKERTNDILYVLSKYNVKATFFVLGQNVQNYPGLALKIVQHGHSIGNHTWNHPYSQQSKASAARQIDRTTDIIYKVTGVKTELFRPPGGYINNGLVAHAKQKQNTIIMWSVDTSDYRNSTKKILDNALNHAKPGGIILLHDGGGDRWNTLIALPHLIEGLQKKGYEFVTIPELLEIENP
jgi:peptidoglycan-N-acetylglucosamine deacetylase